MRQRSFHLLVIAVLAVAAIAVAGCSSATTTSDNTLTGVISEVTGDLTSVSAFVVLDEDGSSHKFVPVEGLLFEGGPLSHLREHIVTGDPVVVTFESGAGGELIAVHVVDE